MTEGLLHPCLERGEGAQPTDAAITDHQRVGVLLQAAALLSHLARWRWQLAGGWRGAVVDRRGRLRGVVVRRGDTREMPQAPLRRLARRLFRAERRIAGRGAARRVARSLMADWHQDLAPVSADEAVTRTLHAAGFLWQPPFGRVRRALAGEYRGPEGAELWIAGPARFRGRVLERSGTVKGAWSLLGGSAAHALWLEAAPTGDPLGLMARGRHRSALEIWRRFPPRTPSARLACGRTLLAAGRFSEARQALTGLRGRAARLVDLAATVRLGELAAARRRLARLAVSELAPADILSAATIAVSLFAELGQPARSGRWVRRALAACRGEQQVEARLVAVAAAWRQAALPAMERRLEAARRALRQPGLAWRWRGLNGRLLLARAEPAAAARELAAALADRRQIGDHAAAGLWRDLGRSRALGDQLAAAERALLHAVRLLRGSDAWTEERQVLADLAQLRLRRGQPVGVARLVGLERPRALREGTGGIGPELETRLELFRGRPQAALAVVQAAREAALERPDAALVLGALAGRALGWLGRPKAALAELAPLPEKALLALEPEERPAVWALAGDRARARAAASGPVAGLWRRLLAGDGSPAGCWQVLERLEPYRAGRLVYDVERVAPGAVPPSWLGRTADSLRQLGAEPLANELDRRREGRWAALASYMEECDGSEHGLVELFAAVAYARPRLSWRRGEAERVLVPGAGGGERLTAECHGGRLLLSATAIDGALRCFFAAARRAPRSPELLATPPPAGGIVGQSAGLRRSLERLGRLAAGELPILIRGETGTGKELAARWAHHRSRRAGYRFLPVNCAALSEGLLLSELFGHARGAFTGADRDRSGIFEAAAGGTVLLDEIGDLPAAAQGKLLRVLQEGEVRRLGESKPRRVDVRVLAATHRDLTAMIATGEFRQDLYYRLRAGEVRLPPLRERGDDLSLLAEAFLGAAGSSLDRLSRSARRRLSCYRWPGNVRELKNVLDVAAALAGEGSIRSRHLDLPAASTSALSGYHEQVESLRRRLVTEALAASDGNRAAAARRLGVSRQALSYLVRRLGIC